MDSEMMPSKKISDTLSGHLLLVALPVIALIGTVMVLYATRWGAFLSDDSFWYILPAEQALQGKGFHPTRTFAPGLSLSLIGLGALGLQPLAAIRWLNAVLFGANILLAGWIVWRAGGGKVGALLTGLLVLLSDVLLETHGWAMSEALNLTLSLLAVLAFQQFIRDPRYVWLAGSTLAASLACLTRYAGIPMVAAIAFGLLVYSPARRFWKRLGHAAIFGSASLLPMAAWWLRNQLVTGQALHYSSFHWAWPTMDTARWFFYSVLSWFVPGRLLHGREIVTGLFFLALAGLLLALWLHWLRRTGRRFTATLDPALFALLINGALIVAMLVIANGFSDLVAFNARYLIMLLLALLMTAATAAAKSLLQLPAAGKAILLAGLVLFTLYYAYRSIDAVRTLHANGLGYVNSFTANSETIRYLKAHPELKVITTGPEGMYFWVGEFYNGIYSTGGDTDRLVRKVCEEQATLVLLNSMPAGMYGFDQDSLTGQLSHQYSFNDSELYICP
jgi:4-amino-4-deoxy-L-arabinose transferase-like glycosyltransferase